MRKEKTNVKNQKGMTLVALVVTIIVLLILAAVALNLTIGENGIITRTKQATIINENANVYEQLQLKVGEYEIDKVESDNNEAILSRLKSDGYVNEDNTVNVENLMGRSMKTGKGSKEKGDVYVLEQMQKTASSVTSDSSTGMEYYLVYYAEGNSSNRNLGLAFKHNSATSSYVDWDKVFETAEKYPGQNEDNENIGLDYLGRPVNMDLWSYENCGTYIDLTGTHLDQYGAIASKGYAYRGKYYDGKIEGEVPMYIKPTGADEFLPVKKMTYTFSKYTEKYDEENKNSELVHAPKIPDSVESMKGTFFNCTALNEVAGLSNSLNDMYETFRGCISLVKTPEIPDSVETMASTFMHCSNLEEISNFSKNVKSMSSTFNDCGKLTNIPEIPNGVMEMDLTFSGCTSLVNAPEIPNSATEMYSTFSSCTSLVDAPEIPDSVTSLEFTFLSCTALVNVPKIPNSVTNMDSTFSNCTSLTIAPEIPDSVTSINSTFSGCTSLVEIPKLSNNVTNLYSTFSDCTSLVNAPTRPDSVTNMSSTFSGCISLVNAPTIPDNVTNMSSTFSDCSSLVEAPKIPEKVTGMNSTFENCINLKKAPIIPESVNTIITTFNNCSSLTGTLTINAKVEPYLYIRGYTNCLKGAATNNDASLILNGTSNYLNAIYNTKSDESNITLQK